jgi:hypothetical protein
MSLQDISISLPLIIQFKRLASLRTSGEHMTSPCYILYLQGTKIVSVNLGGF